jgi:hypothetical protein
MSVGMKNAKAEAAIGTCKMALNKASCEHKQDEKERLGLSERHQGKNLCLGLKSTKKK